MRYFEVEGDSPESILTLFLNQQNIPKEYVEYEVIDAGSKGILGLGKKRAKLKIKYNDMEHTKRKSRMMLSDILEKAGFDEFHIEMKDTKGNIVLNIEIARPDILIGKMAQTLDSLQYLMDKMLRLDDSSDFSMVLDVGGYRQRLVTESVEKAKQIAEQVKSSGRSQKMQPMTTMVRKEIHIALKTIPGVSTLSIGEGQIKQLCIMPEKKPYKKNDN